MKNYFTNKKVLITGHTGFKGSWLTFWLLNLGARIVGVSDKIRTKPSNFEALKLAKKINHNSVNIKNFSKFKKILFKQKPDFLFHLAAEAIVKNSYNNPKNTWETNALGTINVLEALRSFNRNIVVVIITSDKVYDNIETKIGYKETDRLGGFDPYSASKASADLAAQSYINSFLKQKKNIKISIARAGNVIGGGDWSTGRLIPDCIKSWSKKKKVIIRNPISTRPWQHVFDVLRGYMLLAIKLKKNSVNNGEIFNFGPKIKKNSKVIDVIKQASEIWEKSSWKIIRKKIFFESSLLHLSSLKAKKKLKWKCLLNLKESISFTIEWYKNYYSGKNMIDYSTKQLKKYQKFSKFK